MAVVCWESTRSARNEVERGAAIAVGYIIGVRPVTCSYIVGIEVRRATKNDMKLEEKNESQMDGGEKG